MHFVRRAHAQCLGARGSVKPATQRFARHSDAIGSGLLGFTDAGRTFLGISRGFGCRAVAGTAGGAVSSPGMLMALCSLQGSANAPRNEVILRSARNALVY
jgi:hypothetical protein